MNRHVLYSLSTCLFFILIFSSCTKDETNQIELGKPSITIITNNLSVNRGNSVALRFDVEAEAGIKSITVDNQEVDFNSNLTSQTITTQFFIESETDLGDKTLEVVLIDEEDQMAKDFITIEVVPAGAPTLNFTNETAGIASVKRSQELTLTLNINSAEPIDSLVVKNDKNEVVEKFTEFNQTGAFTFSWTYIVPEDIGLTNDYLVLSHTLYDAAEQQTSPAKLNIPIEKSEVEIYTFTQSETNTTVIAEGFGYGTEETTVTFFGSFATDGSPESIQDLEINKADKDSIIYMKLDENSRVTQLFSSNAEGEMHNYLVSFEYPDDTTVHQLIYDYDFESGNNTLVQVNSINLASEEFKALIDNRNARYSSTDCCTDLLAPAIRNMALIGNVTLAVAIGVGTQALFASAGVVIAPYLGAAATIAFAADLMSTAGASEYIPTTEAPTTNQTNPVEGFNSSGLVENPCEGVNITFNVQMDSFGTALFSDWNGGSGGWKFSLDNSPFQTNPAFENIEEGSYLAQVKDDQGCIGAKVVNLTLPEDICADVTISISASLDGNGTITVDASGGTPPYQYALDGSTLQSSNLFSGSYQAGDYTINVVDANECESTETKSLQNCPIISISASLDVNGAITVSAVGGTEPYQYSINGSLFQYSNKFDNGYSDGTYVISVIDNNQCEATIDLNLTKIECEFIFMMNDFISSPFELAYVQCSQIGACVGYQIHNLVVKRIKNEYSGGFSQYIVGVTIDVSVIFKKWDSELQECIDDRVERYSYEFSNPDNKSHNVYFDKIYLDFWPPNAANDLNCGEGIRLWYRTNSNTSTYEYLIPNSSEPFWSECD